MTDRHTDDSGFTLPELLIAITILGIVVPVLVGVFAVMLRNTPTAEARTDAARNVQGLVTWLPQDVDAMPPNGFSTLETALQCAGDRPGINVLHLTFDEPTSTTAMRRHAVSYPVRSGRRRVVDLALRV